MSPVSDPRIVRFGAFELDRKHGELTRSGRRVHLAPQSTRLLDLLVSRAGEIVTRDEICESLWGGQTFVEFEASVNTCVSQIRIVLGDKPTAPRFLETVPRKGYRFVAPVVRPGPQPADDEPAASVAPESSLRVAEPPPLRSESSSVRRWIGGAAIVVTVTAGGLVWFTSYATERPRIAVLPIEAPGGEPELDALGSLLQEGTLVDLHHLAGPSLVVVAKPGVEHARGSERTPGSLRAVDVAYFIDATLRRVANGRIRLHAKVARTSDMRILWARDYEFPRTVFVEQRTSLARELAQRLVAASRGLHAAGQSPSAVVADAILGAAISLERGSALDVERAIAKLTEACAQEPGNSRARALLALANARAAVQSRGRRAILWERARMDALQALGQEPDNPDAAAALGAVQLFMTHEAAGAGRNLQRAAAHARAPVEAHAWLSMWLSSTGAHDRAVSEARKVDRRAPFADSSAALARALYVAGRFDDAREAAARVLSIHPESRGALTWLWLSAAARNSPDQLDILERLVSAITRAPVARRSGDALRWRQALLQRYQTALVREYESGDTAAAFQIGVAAALRSDHADARRWLDRAVRDRAPLAVLIPVHPALTGLQVDP